MQGKFSIKSDVFSFGVLVLEILTGRKSNGSHNPEVTEVLLSYVSNQVESQITLIGFALLPKSNSDFCDAFELSFKLYFPLHRYGRNGKTDQPWR